MIARCIGTRQDNRKENYSRLPFRGFLRVGGQVSDFIVIKKSPLKHCQRHARPPDRLPVRPGHPGGNESFGQEVIRQPERMNSFILAGAGLRQKTLNPTNNNSKLQQNLKHILI